MPMWMIRRFVLRKPEGDGSGGGGAAPAPAPAPAPAAPAPSPAAPSPAPAAPAPSPAAPSPSPAPAAPSPSPAPAAGKWPEDWRETVSKEDAKVLARLQRYGSPEAALQALIAAQNRIASGELKPVLGKDATKEQLAEWRAAHGIPETHDKYDLGKDVKVADADKPMFDVMFKAMHATNATPEHVASVVKTWYDLKQQVEEHQAAQDKRIATESEDALRTEWGAEFRRNMNLVHGLLDGSGSQGLKENVLGGRLADGTPIGSSPEALRMLLGVALTANPTGTVVPGGGGENGETIKTEVEKLQKIPANKKTEAQSTRERDLISAALKAGFMKNDGTWKRA